VEGKTVTEDNIGAVEEVVDAEEEDVASDKADEEEEG
jgi:hypothetical protein